MIEIVISGEGNSDVGHRDMRSSQFVWGPITHLTHNILYFFHKYDVQFHFRPRYELKRYPITLKGKKKKEKLSAGKGHSNLAYKLACIAQEKDAHLAILMRDADNRTFKEVYEEIEGGFEAAKFERGVPAVPVPKSEAWLICCLDPHRSLKIEYEEKEMKELLEEVLLEKGLEHDNDTWCATAIECDVEKIQAPSFRQYIDDLKQATEYLF